MYSNHSGSSYGDISSASRQRQSVIQDCRSDVVHVEGSGDSIWYVEPLYFFVFDGDPFASTLMLIRSDGPIRHDFIGRLYANKLVVDNTI